MGPHSRLASSILERGIAEIVNNCADDPRVFDSECDLNAAGDLYGFDRIPSLTLMPAQDIAEAARKFGQEDDISVLTLAFAEN
jgi:hypothetical protein